MCGILAIFKTTADSPAVASEELKTMARAISPETTEGASYALWDDFLGLGQTDCGGNRFEPLYNKTGTLTLVADAKLIDRSTWLRRLSGLGYQFGAQSDNEILLYAYEEFGVNCFAEFKGSFAFIIWDSTKETLIAGRDSEGLAPLYATEQKGRLHFASELKGFFAIKTLEKKLSPRYFSDSLIASPFPNTTPFLGLISVRPGTYLTMLRSGKWEEHFFSAKTGDASSPLLAKSEVDIRSLTPDQIAQNLHAYLWAREFPAETIAELINPVPRPRPAVEPWQKPSPTKYGIPKRYLPFLIHPVLRSILPPQITVIDLPKLHFSTPHTAWRQVSETVSGKVIFENYLSLKELDETKIFAPIPVKAILFLWRKLPKHSQTGIALDHLVGYILCCQIINRLFLKYRFTADSLHYWEEVTPEKHLSPRAELLKDDHPPARAFIIPSYLESKSLSDWQSFVLRHTHPANFVFHFVSMLFFFVSPIVAIVTQNPNWLALFFVSGMVGTAGHFLFKDGKVSVKEATIRLQVPYFVLKMFSLLFSGKYSLEIKKAQTAYASVLGQSTENKQIS